MVRRIAVWSVVLTLAAAPAAVARAQSPAEAPKSSSKAEARAEGVINLNSATLADLESLPGIGKSTAQRILEYRQKSGGFKKIEELLEIWNPRGFLAGFD